MEIWFLLIYLKHLKMDSKNIKLNSPGSIADLLSASDKSLVTAWTSSVPHCWGIPGCIMLKPSHGTCSIPPIPLHPFFILSSFLFCISKSKSLQVYWGCSAEIPAVQPQPPVRPEKCGGSGKLMKTCDLSCASDQFSLVGPSHFQGLPCYSAVSSLGCTLG